MKRTCSCLCVTVALLLATLALASSAFAQNYVILYKQSTVAPDTAATVKQAGGSVVATYPQIGVVIARSSSPGFTAGVLKDARVDSAASTKGFGVQVPDESLTANGPPPAGSRTHRRATRTICPRSSGTWRRSTPLKRMRSRAAAGRSWSETSTAG